MEATPCAPSAARRLDLDNLRNAAVLLLIVFHTARLFDGEAWHIKDAGHYWPADTVVRAGGGKLEVVGRMTLPPQ